MRKRMLLLFLATIIMGLWWCSPVFAEGTTFEELVYFGKDQSPTCISRLIQDIDNRGRVMFQLDYNHQSEQIVMGLRGRFRKLAKGIIIQPRALALISSGSFTGVKLQTCSAGQLGDNQFYIFNSCIFPRSGRLSFYNEVGIELLKLSKQSDLWAIIEEDHKAGTKSNWKIGPEISINATKEVTVKLHHCFGIAGASDESLFWIIYNL